MHCLLARQTDSSAYRRYNNFAPAVRRKWINGAPKINDARCVSDHSIKNATRIVSKAGGGGKNAWLLASGIRTHKTVVHCSRKNPTSLPRDKEQNSRQRVGKIAASFKFSFAFTLQILVESIVRKRAVKFDETPLSLVREIFEIEAKLSDVEKFPSKDFWSLRSSFHSVS